MKTNGQSKGPFASKEVGAEQQPFHLILPISPQFCQRRKRRATSRKDSIGSIECNAAMTNENQQQQILPNPSLIRRARLIRRRTTNVYCETLKRLKEEDATLISQILLIGLKPRSEASDFECSSSGSSGSSVIPSVEFACPPLGSEFLHFPPTLFYPDFMKGTIQRREEREAFQVILTNEKGERKFAFCFKFLRPQYLVDDKRGSVLSPGSGVDTLRSLGPFSVLVFISPYPQEALFHELAASFVDMLHNDESKMVQMGHDLLRIRFTTSEPSVKASKHVIGGTKYANHWSRSNVSTVVEKVGVENAALIFLCLLSERRVIVTGANVTDVSTTVHTFVRLLAPLEWPHTLIPIVPDSQTELCFNPTPYICGILRYNLNRISELLCPERYSKDESLNGDIVVMDVERGMIVPPISRSDRHIGLKAIIRHAAAMGFPHSAVCEIVSAFKSCLPVRDPEKSDHKIEKKVMIWYAKLFGHYRKFGQNILSARNRKLFARAHPCAETRLFLKWFVENGILQSFIFAQFRCGEDIISTNSLSNSCGLLHRFQKILKKYAPPVDGNGNRRRTKSFLWRIFTH